MALPAACHARAFFFCFFAFFTRLATHALTPRHYHTTYTATLPHYLHRDTSTLLTPRHYHTTYTATLPHYLHRDTSTLLTPRHYHTTYTATLPHYLHRDTTTLLTPRHYYVLNPLPHNPILNQAKHAHVSRIYKSTGTCVCGCSLGKEPRERVSGKSRVDHR
jgi:hypothetical protein